MSAVAPDIGRVRPAWPVDETRGQWGMLLFMVTEATFFLMLFFAYFYLRHSSTTWTTDPPKLSMALVMAAVLISSSLVLRWGERRLDLRDPAAARASILGTVALGLLFLLLQTMEYAERLKRLTPQSNAYGSIFYTITSAHAAHLLLGILMLSYVFVLPDLAGHERPPHRPLHNAGLYWHFVDAVWIVIVIILYVMPRFTR
jgi:cytochrome c oxidase subunit III